MSTKTSREIALERRKAMSDGGKKAALYSSSTKDRVRSSQDIHSTGATSSNKKVLTHQVNQIYLPIKLLENLLHQNYLVKNLV